MRTCILLLALSLSFSISAQDVPDGWRPANGPELSSNALRKKSPSQFTRVEADFNGDGVNDVARLFKSTYFSGEGLLVYLSGENGFEWSVLEKIDWGPDYSNVSLAMGVDLAEAKNYMTACGKGQWQCDEYETAEFGTKLPGIWHFRMGGHKALFYWNKEKQKFDKQWITN